MASGPTACFNVQHRRHNSLVQKSLQHSHQSNFIIGYSFRITMSDNDMSRSPNRQLNLESGRGQQPAPESPSGSKCNTHFLRLGWIWTQLQLVFTNWFDITLIIVPIAWIANFTPVPSYVAFPVNLIAIIPLAKVTSKLTEELAEESNPWTAAL